MSHLFFLRIDSDPKATFFEVSRNFAKIQVAISLKFLLIA
ncbi:hypothetical protein I569_01521 [Enterococcus dispar ATCC 51266]|mgnify:CR=1 FL=1|jgi:hypothetical protein|uniref:Uncharacterized protein n=1 Tax=Enterococcus dispar ATCC 51266 TaxID=1139219 RepID=S1NKG1_9ENTE|nr:hypothetical protein OMK_02383 [Enterococcus dispar ATCC 51266]EOW86198.1 hypothetical protein I569_01521 [Enterococcus dispar ATCC 51266]